MNTKIIAVVVGCAILIGCAGAGYRAENPYQGELSQDKVAVLKVGQSTDVRKDIQLAYRGLNIEAVDDIRAGTAGQALMMRYVNEMWLLPGRHTVRLVFKRNNTFAVSNLWFDAEAGKTYTGKYEQTGRWSVRVWIEENETHAPVGGIADPADAPK